MRRPKIRVQKDVHLRAAVAVEVEVKGVLLPSRMSRTGILQCKDAKPPDHHHPCASVLGSTRDNVPGAMFRQLRTTLTTSQKSQIPLSGRLGLLHLCVAESGWTRDNVLGKKSLQSLPLKAMSVNSKSTNRLQRRDEIVPVPLLPCEDTSLLILGNGQDEL